MSHDIQAFVVDNGTGEIKAGFSGDDKPQLCFPSVVGTSLKAAKSKRQVGSEALKQIDTLEIEYPIERGRIKNMDLMEDIWSHAFDSLKVDPRERNILLTEPPLNPKILRENITTVMFENFGVDGLYAADIGNLSRYSVGRNSSFVLHSGYDTTFAMPTYEGYLLPHTIQELNIGGRHITDYLMKLLIEKENSSFLTTDRIKKIKENECFFLNEKEEQPDPKEYKLPDGRLINLEEERYLCPEILFQPNLIGNESEGIVETIQNSILKCDVDIRQDQYNDVILSGGSTLFKGFPEKLKQKLEAVAPKTMRVNVVAFPERKLSVWIGGSLMTSLSTFQQMWITKQEYDEFGPGIVHRKCY